MDPKTIEMLRQIAIDASQNALVGAWWFWLILFVAPAIGAWIGGHFKKRGETAAIRRDLDEIKDQLAATTRVTEDIKAKISFDDWWKKETLTIRRNQLEKIMSAVFRADDAIHNWWVNASGSEDSFPEIPRASLQELASLVSLYHPELKPLLEKFDSAWKAHINPASDFRNRQLLNSKMPLDELRALLNERTAKYSELAMAINTARDEFAEAISKLMHILMTHPEQG